MKFTVAVDGKELVRLTERWPRASADAISTFTERVGRKVEREAKNAMRANVAGPGQARSRTGNLVRQIRFIHSGAGGVSGVVKAFANYSKYVHGPPFHNFMGKRGGGIRKINPFFTSALANSDSYIEQQKAEIVRNIGRRV